jgi:hypothetical protein
LRIICTGPPATPPRPADRNVCGPVAAGAEHRGVMSVAAPEARLVATPGVRAEVGAPSVVVVEPERMSVLGLILASLLRRRLAEPSARRHAHAMRGDVLVEASGMHVTLSFEPGRIWISRGAAAHPRARIRGTLAALLGAALGHDRLRNVLTGQLRVRGSALALWRLLALMRADRE